MEFIKQGFKLNYSLNEMSVIKPGKNGVIKETGYAYGASLKIKTQNLIQFIDHELGEIDKEELLEFKILCDTDADAIELNKLFRVLKNNGVVVSLDGSLPKYRDNSDYLEVTVYQTPLQLMQKYHDHMIPMIPKTADKIKAQ